MLVIIFLLDYTVGALARTLRVQVQSSKKIDDKLFRKQIHITYTGQIYSGDFAKFCGLLRIYEFTVLICIL